MATSCSLDCAVETFEVTPCAIEFTRQTRIPHARQKKLRLSNIVSVQPRERTSTSPSYGSLEKMVPTRRRLIHETPRSGEKITFAAHERTPSQRTPCVMSSLHSGHFMNWLDYSGDYDFRVKRAATDHLWLVSGSRSVVDYPSSGRSLDIQSPQKFQNMWPIRLPHNDGVHRVAAGGRLKNRKPTGRNSGATLC
jgi:hypothetical protein